MTKSKRIPMRKCIGCNEMKGKNELVRVVKTAEGISLDLSGKADGRGAYICKCVSCLENALKKRSLERSFSQPVSDEIKSCLQKEFEKFE